MKKIFLYMMLSIMIITLASCQTKKSSEAVIDQFSPPQKGETIAIIHTNMGDIKVKFFPQAAPKAVENFTKLAQTDYYDNLTFHRVMNEFMIQGGDPTATGMGGESIYGKPFEDEFNSSLHNFRGALSMANSGPNTNESQFFIVQRRETGEKVEKWMEQNNIREELKKAYREKGGAPWLDNKHTIFGQVFEGMEVVDKIAETKVTEEGKPIEDVVIKDVEITKFK